MADITNLIYGMKQASTWIFTLFSRFVEEIMSNDLLIYPVLLCIVIAAVYLVVRIVKSFGMRSRRS